MSTVHNFAGSSAGALLAEGSVALIRKDLPTVRRALSCALAYLSHTETIGSGLPPDQSGPRVSSAQVSQPRLHTLYDAAFYAGQVDGSARSAEVVVPLVMEIVRDVASVVDVGCGAGVWLAAFRDAGVKTVMGLDGGAAAHTGQLKIDPQYFLAVDLEGSFNLPMRYDLCTCLEVAEHLAPGVAASFVKNLCGLSDVVLFSAALPGQGGTGHVNERWPSYWAELFGANGYKTHDILRSRIWYDRRIDWWYRQNLVIFAKASARQRVGAANPGKPAGPLDIVHPETFQQYRGVPPQPAQVEAPIYGLPAPAATVAGNSELHT